MEDPDIECTAVMPAGPGGDFSTIVRSDDRARGLPETPSELFAYDAIILSNVPREALERQVHGLDRRVDRPPRRRALHGRRAELVRLGPVGRHPGRPDAPGRGRARRARLGRVARRDPARRRRGDPPALAHRRRRRAEPGPAQDPAELPRPQPARPGQADGRGPGPGRPRLARRRAGLAVQPYRPGPDDGPGHRDHPPVRRRVHPVLGPGRRPLLQEVLAERGLLADRELVDRPPPAPGRDRQAALPARASRSSCRPGPSTRTPRRRSTTGWPSRSSRSRPPTSTSDNSPLRKPAAGPAPGRRPGPAPPLGRGVRPRQDSPPRSRTPPPCRSPTARTSPPASR